MTSFAPSCHAWQVRRLAAHFRNLLRLSEHESYNAKLKGDAAKKREEQRRQAAVVVQSRGRGHIGRARAKKTAGERHQKLDRAATSIQSKARGRQVSQCG